MKIYVELPAFISESGLTNKKTNSRTDAAWWKKLSKDEQRRYMRNHKQTRKKQSYNKINEDGEGHNSKKLFQKVTDPRNHHEKLNSKKRSTKSPKPKKKWFTSDELLKNAGIGDGTGLSKFSPNAKHNKQHKPTKQERAKHLQEQRERSVVKETNLPFVHPEHHHWNGFRKNAYKQMDKMAEKHLNTIKKAPRVSMHRAYNGMADFLQGKQPNKAKRQAAESMMLDHLKALRENMPEHEHLNTLAKYDKELVSMYFGSVKKRYKDKPLPFKNSTHETLSKFKATPKKVNTSISSLINPTKTDHEEFKHVSKFAGSDLIEWLSSQDKEKMEFYLKSRKNNSVTLRDAQKAKMV